MALHLSPQDKTSIQNRTIVYDPIYSNGMTARDSSGCYVLFYIFSKKDTLSFSPSKCIVESLDMLGRNYEHTFVKIGNFSNGSKSRFSTNKGDLIKLDGNRSPAARHSQDVLMMYPDLYLHFIMVVLTSDTVESHLEKSLEGIVSSIHNKQEKLPTQPGRWNPPKSLTNFNKISPKLAERINKKA